SDRYNVHSLDFEGHGKAPLQERPFRMEHFAESVRDYLKQHAIERTHIFGYSMGGYVAVTLANTHPHLVQSIATLGTKFYWDSDIAAREVALLDPEKIAAKVPHYARALAERHTAAGWETVVSRTRDLLMHLAEQRGLRAENVAHIEQRVRVIIGDRDSTVSVTESVEIYRALPNGEMEVLPSTAHQWEKVSPARLAYSLGEFFG
ncbi:MAG TPA: alpha/beta fold hydrolase, partial [Chloroflexia bacterium]|nr:alpha/beta fold hydrolase [Chloroflexia bacterium]